MTAVSTVRDEREAPRWTRGDSIAVLIVVTVSALLVWPELFRDWYAWDDGAMAQAADRVLHGQLPHRDFDDPWTGGWSFYQALIFRLFGESLRMIRVPIFALWLASLVVGYRLTRRYVAPATAGVATFGWAVWTLYAWHFPLLNWYYAPLALGAVWCVVRFGETGRARFVVAAGALAGVAIVIKVTGLFLLAGLLLWTAAYAAAPHHRGTDTPAGDPAVSHDARRGPSIGFAALVAAAGAVFVVMVVRLLRGLPAEIHGSALGLFGAPIALTVATLTWMAWSSGRTLADGLARVLRVALPLAVGVALAMVPFVAYFAWHGALRDLYVGVLVRPSARLSLIWTAPPGRVATGGMLLAPLVLLLGLGWARAQNGWRDAIVALVLGVGAGALARLDPFTAGAVSLIVRGLPIVLPIAALWILWHRRGDAGAVLSPTTMLLVALATCSQLLQIPWASLSYALYATPLAVIALVALARAANPSPSAAVLMVGAFLSVAGYGHLATNADKRPAERYALLPLARAGLWVSPADSARFVDVAALVRQRPGPVHVIGDAPEFAFLLERSTPSRALYDVLADSAVRDPALVLPMLDRAGVRTVLLANQFGMNDSTTMRQQRALIAAFPHSRGVGRRVWDGRRVRFEVDVRWRDSIPTPAR